MDDNIDDTDEKETRTNRRAPNFSSPEVNLLISLTKRYVYELEPGRKTFHTLEIKRKTWWLIEREFNNAKLGTYRTHKILRIKYENIKKRSKKKPFLSDYGSCDTQVSGPDHQDCTDPLESGTENSDGIAGEIVQDCNGDWSLYTPEGEMPNSVESKKKSNSTKANSNGAPIVVTWERVPEKQQIEEIKELKKRHLQELHDESLKQSREIHAQMLRHREEEHSLKIELLNLEKAKLYGV